jgi:hypothetical protein
MLVPMDLVTQHRGYAVTAGNQYRTKVRPGRNTPTQGEATLLTEPFRADQRKCLFIVIDKVWHEIQPIAWK